MLRCRKMSRVHRNARPITPGPISLSAFPRKRREKKERKSEEKERKNPENSNNTGGTGFGKIFVTTYHVRRTASEQPPIAAPQRRPHLRTPPKNNTSVSRKLRPREVGRGTLARSLGAARRGAACRRKEIIRTIVAALVQGMKSRRIRSAASSEVIITWTTRARREQLGERETVKAGARPRYRAG